MRRVRKLAEPIRIRIGSWNVGSLIRRRVNILCVQETKWKGQKAKEVEDTSFKLWYTWVSDPGLQDTSRGMVLYEI